MTSLGRNKIQVLKTSIVLIVLWSVFTCCNKGDGREQHTKSMQVAYRSIAPLSPIVRKEVPVLCYHQVRNWKTSDSKTDRTYIMPVDKFSRQIKMLRDSGYHTILPDQLVSYMKGDVTLPPHSLLLTFDDGTESQYTAALPELDSTGFKATFFIMTAVLNHSQFMSSEQVATLARQGHTIGCHTWDHHNVTQYDADDWLIQLERPTTLLKRLTGNPIVYFAYPFGTWNEAAIPYLEKNGYTAAFQLWGMTDAQKPQYTIRRILVSGYWDTKQLLTAVRNVENQPAR